MGKADRVSMQGLVADELSPHGRLFWQGSDPVGSIQELWEDGRLCVKQDAEQKLLLYPEQRWSGPRTWELGDLPLDTLGGRRKGAEAGVGSVGELWSTSKQGAVYLQRGLCVYSEAMDTALGPR